MSSPEVVQDPPHLFTVDVSAKGFTGRQAERALGEARITVNKNLIPFDTLPPKKASGVRIGCAALSTRGMDEDDMRQIGDWIDAVLDHIDDDPFIAEVRKAYPRRQFHLRRV